MAQNYDNKYNLRGASASKSEVHQAIKNIDKGLFPGAFCKVVPDYLAGDKDYCNIIHADGAGTKSSLAYIYYKETGDKSVFRGIAQDSLVMNLDDLLAVGATDNFILSNTIGRNKNLVPAEVIAEIIEGYEDVIRLLKKYDINVISCGGETADVGDLVRTLIVDSTICVRMRKDQVINNERIKPGNVIVGLASDGRANYETRYNAGMGSNGLTSARHDVFSKIYREKYPESFDQSIPEEVTYTGNYYLTDDFGIGGLTVGQAVLSPTRTYAPILKTIYDKYFAKINGVVHNSGGALTKCRSFGMGLHYVKDNLFETPRLFKLIQESANTNLAEMYQVFNMGCRMEIYTDEETAEQIIATAKEFDIEAQIIGHVEKNLEAGKNKVTIKDNGNNFSY
jgi:phosphoribosylformylglycinamidine cyclo-ligase